MNKSEASLVVETKAKLWKSDIVDKLLYWTGTYKYVAWNVTDSNLKKGLP